MAIGVDKAGLEDIVEVGTLLVGESGAVAILLGTGEVNFLMGDVEITAEDNGFGLFQLFAIVEKISVPLLTVGKAA